MPHSKTRPALNALPDARLFKIVRDPRAPDRLLALLILVERCSSYLRRKEIAADVEALLATTPGVPD